MRICTQAHTYLSEADKQGAGPEEVREAKCLSLHLWGKPQKPTSSKMPFLVLKTATPYSDRLPLLLCDALGRPEDEFCSAMRGPTLPQAALGLTGGCMGLLRREEVQSHTSTSDNQMEVNCEKHQKASKKKKIPTWNHLRKYPSCYFSKTEWTTTGPLYPFCPLVQPGAGQIHPHTMGKWIL